jgi:alpha-beta hydrolase superfamily lysophospholipase
MKWVRRILLGMAIAVALFFCVLLPVAGSFLITNSHFRFPEKDAHSPEELGLSVESAEFTSKDGIPLRGWWIPGDEKFPVIIFVHGLNRSRLELLSRAAESHKRGYGVLLFDLRNHGESGRAYTTLGINETQDVCAASNWVRSQAPGRSQFLWGVSLGASTALLALRDCGGFDAVVSDSAFNSFRDTIAHHLKLYFHLPPFPVAKLIVLITSVRMGIDPDKGDVESVLKHDEKTPILFIAGGADRRMPPDVAKRLFDDTPNPLKRMVVISGAGHGQAYSVDPKTYLESVFGLFAIIRAHGNIS